MQKTQILLIFMISVFFGMIGGFMELPFWIMMVAIFIVVIPISLYPIINSLYLTININKVEQFLVKRKKQPVYRYYYSLANRDREETDEALKVLMEKYKNNPHWKAVFEVAYAAHFNNLLSVKNQINDIKQKEIRDYYSALVLVEQQDFENARILSNQLKKAWMKESVLAVIAKNRGRDEEALNHKNKAIEHARGLQRYILMKEQENKS